jgi:2-methylcitrate dehydratase
VDATTERIVDFVHSLPRECLSESVVHQIKRRLVDSIGCAIGAIDSAPAQIARSLAREATGSRSATVIGLPQRTSLEMATFANAVMVRYLDFNDMYFSPRGGGGHPSDLLSTALAVGQSLGASGLDVMLSIVVGYEVVGRLIGVVRLRERGWDQGLYTVVASAMMAGKLLGLSRDQLGHAVALAITPHVPMRQTRVGELSMWKGCATAGAARNGVFAALLASKGMTGPPQPIEGGDALWQLVTGPFQLDFSPHPMGLVIEQISTKFRPVEYNAQGPLDAMLSLRSRAPVDEIERIDVETYWLTYSEIGSEPAKWDPQTRETADHSLPYLLAVLMVDGEVGLEAFTSERILDPKLRPLMNRIHITERAEYTKRFPAELMCRIVVRTRPGEVHEEEIAYPRGHVRNPLTDGEIDQKFEGLIRGRDEHDIRLSRQVRGALWAFDKASNVSTALEPLGDLRAK